VTSVVRLQERIAAMMMSGVPLETIESEVIDTSGLSSERKAALWLYAWSFMEGTGQHAEERSSPRVRSGSKSRNDLRLPFPD
jgi:hypothetical protein